MSTMTAILGRLATYSGQEIEWEDAFVSEKVITTDAESWDAAAPCKPLADGGYRIPIPGVTRSALALIPRKKRGQAPMARTKAISM